MATNWTLTQVLNQLNSGSLWSSDTITYSFPSTSANMYTGGGEGGGFKPLSNLQITIAEYALTGWDDLIASTFVEGSGKTNIEIANTTTGIDYAHAYYPNTGSVWFNSDYDDVKNPVVGDYGYGTFIHEIGHALGLDHMGDYNGNGSWAPSSYQDSTVLSIMSYFGPDHSDGEGKVMWADWMKGGTTYSAQTPMLNDVMAIQAMYGADTTTRTGATVYGFNSNITGNAGKIFDFDVNGNPIVCIYDAGGNDTLDLSGFSTKSTISLVAGTFSDCNEMTNNISIAYSATIENAVGGSANDTITGNDADNVLTGGRGNDTIDGGAGNDVAVFSGAYADYTVVSNGNGAYTVTDNAGKDGKDTLTSIELLRFSDRDVTDGDGGSDDSDTAPVLVQALDDQNAEAGTLFSFTIPAGAFADPNGDALTFSAKLPDGGSLPAWLSFDVSTGTFSGTPGAADGGTFSIVVSASDGSEKVSDTFEIIVDADDGGDGSIILGNKRSNNLVGDDGAETFRALGGKDKIFAGAGNDTLEGGTGRDLLWGERGADIFKFGNKNGMDDIKDFSLAEGDRIDLSEVSAITDYSDLVNNHLSSYVGDAYISISKKHDILIVGIDAADLMNESNFIF
jgi:serralysin